MLRTADEGPSGASQAADDDARQSTDDSLGTGSLPLGPASLLRFLVGGSGWSGLTRDTLVRYGWWGVSFRWYYGVGGLVVGH